MTLPSLNSSDLAAGELGALAENYAREARSLLLPGLLGHKRDHPDLVEPLGIKQLEQIAMHRGVVVIDTEAPIASEGQLIPLPQGGYRLRIAAGSNRQRSRFTMAHEIAHTYFQHASEPAKKTRYRSGAIDRGELEERFCDLFAACLLMPKDSALVEFGQLTHVRLPREFVRKIEQIALRWGISTLSALSRLSDTVGIPAGMLAVVLRWKLHRSKRSQPACRVESFFRNPLAMWHVPPNQRACTIGLVGANDLFEYWQSLPHLDQVRGGYWTLEVDEEGNTVIGTTSVRSADIPQRLTIWLKRGDDPWRKASIDSIVNYRLYGAARSKPYCLALASVPTN